MPDDLDVLAVAGYGRAYAFAVRAPIRHMNFPYGRQFGICISCMGANSTYANWSCRYATLEEGAGAGGTALATLGPAAVEGAAARGVVDALLFQ